jgi:uncharacterized protein (DUF1800 family)
MEVIETTIGAVATSETAARHAPTAGAIVALGTLLSACGGGGGPTADSGGTALAGVSGSVTVPGSQDAAGTRGSTPSDAPSNAATTAETISPALASRFLAQASLGASRAQMARVQALGYSGWIDEQMKIAPTISRWDWLIAKGFGARSWKGSDGGADQAIWHGMFSGSDTLRQRVTFALSEILVTSISGFDSDWPAFSAAAYLDLLQANAFGNYRTLLQQVSTSTPMGEFLTFRGSVRQNTTTGAMPDENYARECMQLFTIGLVQLNLDGTPKLVNGAPQETYTLDDVTGLARVFTGWDYDMTGTTINVPDFKRRPMTVTASRHENGSKTFLGTTIPAGTSAQNSLTMALDAIFAHANIAPNISRQLIQRLVTSNPSPAYVARVATVFNNDGAGVKGNLKAVIKAILLDPEARSSANIGNPSFGKQREPVLRLTAWIYATSAAATKDSWTVGNESDPVLRLGQSPLRSGSVFNFFRPGYVPPNSAVASAGLVAPEFQITNESSVIGYINYMQNVVRDGAGDVKTSYAAYMPLAFTSQALVDELNLVMVAGQLSTSTVALIKGAVDSLPIGKDAARLNRIYTALILVLASPEFIIQK